MNYDTLGDDASIPQAGSDISSSPGYSSTVDTTTDWSFFRSNVFCTIVYGLVFLLLIYAGVKLSNRKK